MPINRQLWSAYPNLLICFDKLDSYLIIFCLFQVRLQQQLRKTVSILQLKSNDSYYEQFIIVMSDITNGDLLTDIKNHE